MRRNLFNMNPASELFQMLTGAFKALERGVRNLAFRGRSLQAKTNPRGRAYFEIPAHLDATFRVYQPDASGRGTVMVVIKDMYANRVDAEGTENPVLWGQLKRGTNQKLMLWFFNDPPAREAIQELKLGLANEGVVEPAKLFTAEEVESLHQQGKLLLKTPKPRQEA